MDIHTQMKLLVFVRMLCLLIFISINCTHYIIHYNCFCYYIQLDIHSDEVERRYYDDGGKSFHWSIIHLVPSHICKVVPQT